MFINFGLMIFLESQNRKKNCWNNQKVALWENSKVGFVQKKIFLNK